MQRNCIHIDAGHDGLKEQLVNMNSSLHRSNGKLLS